MTEDFFDFLFCFLSRLFHVVYSRIFLVWGTCAATGNTLNLADMHTYLSMRLP